jgi:hypothetical protein
VSGTTRSHTSNNLSLSQLPTTCVPSQDRPKASTLSNKQGLVTLSKAEFLRRLNEEWKILLDPREILNLCFYFEYPNSFEDYNKANNTEGLDNLGSFAPTRWKHIREIHVLFPSVEGHFYVARRADLPHYQEVFSKFISALESYDDSMPVYLYMGSRNYRNHFLTVCNTAKKVKPFVNRMDWMEVHRVACRPKKKATKNAAEKKRQDTYEDTGFCSSVNQTRDGTLDGVAEPRLKPQTTVTAEAVNAYVVLSDFLIASGAEWSDGCLFDDPDRHERFASKIHPKNVFECMRLSVTDVKSKCACHRDLHNSNNPSYRSVVGMSVVRTVGGKDVRIAINAQARKSIDECMSRSQLYGPLITMVLSEYEKMPETRRVLSKSSLLGQNAGGMVGFRCLANPCNMDPMSYYQPFLHYSLLLVDHFGLSFPETISLVSAIEILPNTAYFFATAAAALLATNPKDIPGRHRGFAFGYLVASLSLHFRRIRSESCPGIRFKMYWEPELPSGLEWERRCSLKTLACLRFHAAYGSLIDKKKRALQYKKLRIHFCSSTENVGLLITNHVLGISSCLGLLPAWVRGEIELSPSNRSAKWFLEKFNLPSNIETVEQITENLRHALSTRYGITVTRRTGENILCKIYRLRTESTSDSSFFDLAFKGQMLFQSEGDGLRISFPKDELEDIIVDDYLIKRWSYGNTVLTVDEIIGKIGMSDRGVPTAMEAKNWSVPDDLMFGRASTSVDFDMANEVEVTCDVLLRYHLKMISEKLKGGK